MKIHTTIEKISEAVAKIHKISSKNISLPVLENVLIEASKNTLVFRATNLHIGVEVEVPVKVEQEGVLAVNLQLFSNIINSIKGNQNINLELVGSVLVITTQDSQMEVKTFPYDDFPTLPHPTDDVYFTVEIDKFIEGIRSVMHSASFSDIKPEISSVYIYSQDNMVVFVATDSFRLAEKKITIDDLEDFPGIIVPIKNIQECVRIFNNDTGKVKLYVEKNQLSIISKNTFFTTRIVDGNYPDYQKIIPQEYTTEAIVLKDDINQTLRLVNVFSNSFNQISLKTSEKEGKIIISSRNTDIGENNSSVDAVVKGEDQQMFFNHKYISDVLPSLSSDSLSFSLVAKNKPFILKAVGDKSFLYLIMPMNR